MSFWDERRPCWKITDCPLESRQKCGAYIAQHYPCWELPLEERCPIANKVDSCEECQVYMVYNEEKGEYICQEEDRARKVLVADDELLIRWSLYQALRKVGFDVTIAADGSEALDKLNDGFFDVVLVDWKMPRLDGFSFAEEVQKISPRSRVILMTAHGSEEVKQRAREMGIRYVPKPLDIDQISEIVS